MSVAGGRSRQGPVYYDGEGESRQEETALKHNEPGRHGGCDGGGQRILLSASAGITQWSKLTR